MTHAASHLWRRGALVFGIALLAACDDVGPTATARGSDAAGLLGATTGRTFLVGFHSAPGAAATALVQGLGGRVVHHLKAFLSDPNNLVLLAGFQAPGTRGAALARGALGP